MSCCGVHWLKGLPSGQALKVQLVAVVPIVQSAWRSLGLSFRCRYVVQMMPRCRGRVGTRAPVHKALWHEQLPVCLVEKCVRFVAFLKPSSDAKTKSALQRFTNNFIVTDLRVMVTEINIAIVSVPWISEVALAAMDSACKAGEACEAF